MWPVGFSICSAGYNNIMFAFTLTLTYELDLGLRLRSGSHARHTLEIMALGQMVLAWQWETCQLVPLKWKRRRRNTTFTNEIRSWLCHWPKYYSWSGTYSYGLCGAGISHLYIFEVP